MKPEINYLPITLMINKTVMKGINELGKTLK